MHAGSSKRMDEQDGWDSTSLDEQDEPIDYLMGGYPVSIYCSKLTIETLEQGVKYVQSSMFNFGKKLMFVSCIIL